MMKAIKAALKYKTALPVAIDLLQEIHKAVQDDGSISRKERSALMSKFWLLVKVVQAPYKKTSPASKKAV